MLISIKVSHLCGENTTSCASECVKIHSSIELDTFDWQNCNNLEQGLERAALSGCPRVKIRRGDIFDEQEANGTGSRRRADCAGPRCCTGRRQPGRLALRSPRHGDHDSEAYGADRDGCRSEKERSL